MSKTRCVSDTTVQYVEPGQNFYAFGRTFTVLEHLYRGTLALDADSIASSCYGTSSDYLESDVRHIINGEYLNYLQNHGCIQNTHILSFVEGFNDYAALLSIEQYHKYKIFIPDASVPFWLRSVAPVVGKSVHLIRCYGIIRTAMLDLL